MRLIILAFYSQTVHSRPHTKVFQKDSSLPSSFQVPPKVKTWTMPEQKVKFFQAQWQEKVLKSQMKEFFKRVTERWKKFMLFNGKKIFEMQMKDRSFGKIVLVFNRRKKFWNSDHRAQDLLKDRSYHGIVWSIQRMKQFVFRFLSILSPPQQIN